MFLLRRIARAGAAVAVAATLVPAAVTARDVLSGPYRAKVERVVDGDTLAARVTVWLGQEIEVLVRVRGIDAPELRGDCDSEELRAAEATAALAGLVGDGVVTLTAIEGDKFFGRVLANVATAEGDDAGTALLAGGFVRAYDGGPRRGWCEIGSADPDGDGARAALTD